MKKRKFFSDWRFYVLISVILVGLLLVLPWAFIAFLYFSEVFQGFKIEKFYGFAIATVIMAGLAIALIWVLPIMLYLLCKIRDYFSIILSGIRCGYGVRIKRFPFASLFRIHEKEDIRITVNKTVYCIHFIDIPFKHKRHFSVIGDNKYCISNLVPDKIVSYGKGRFNGGVSNSYAYRVGASSLEGDRERPIPKVREERNTSHVIMLCRIPISTYRVTENGVEELVGGIRINDTYYYYTRKTFISMLKRNRIK